MNYISGGGFCNLPLTIFLSTDDAREAHRYLLAHMRSSCKYVEKNGKQIVIRQKDGARCFCLFSGKS